MSRKILSREGFITQRGVGCHFAALVRENKSVSGEFLVSIKGDDSIYAVVNAVDLFKDQDAPKIKLKLEIEPSVLEFEPYSLVTDFIRLKELIEQGQVELSRTDDTVDNEDGVEECKAEMLEYLAAMAKRNLIASFRCSIFVKSSELISLAVEYIPYSVGHGAFKNAERLATHAIRKISMPINTMEMDGEAFPDFQPASEARSAIGKMKKLSREEILLVNDIINMENQGFTHLSVSKLLEQGGPTIAPITRPTKGSSKKRATTSRSAGSPSKRRAPPSTADIPVQVESDDDETAGTGSIGDDRREESPPPNSSFSRQPPVDLAARAREDIVGQVPPRGAARVNTLDQGRSISAHVEQQNQLHMLNQMPSSSHSNSSEVRHTLEKVMSEQDIKKTFRHLCKNLSIDIVKELTPKDATEFELNLLKDSNLKHLDALEKNLAEVRRGKIFPESLDDRDANLHPLTFERFPLASQKELQRRFKEQFPEGVPPIQSYNLSGTDYAGCITPRGWTLVHDPRDGLLRLRMFSKQNALIASSNRRSMTENSKSSEDKDFVDLSSVVGVLHAWGALRTASRMALPWRLWDLPIENFLFLNNYFGKEKIDERPRNCSQHVYLTQLIEHFFAENANRFIDGKIFLSNIDLKNEWERFNQLHNYYSGGKKQFEPKQKSSNFNKFKKGSNNFGNSNSNSSNNTRQASNSSSSDLIPEISPLTCKAFNFRTCTNKSAAGGCFNPNYNAPRGTIFRHACNKCGDTLHGEKSCPKVKK